MELSPSALSETALLGLLRAYSLCFIRFEGPDTETSAKLIAALDRSRFSKAATSSEAVQTEWIQLMVYLDAPGVVEQGLALMTRERAPQEPDWNQVLTRNGGYGGTIQRMLDNPPPTTGLAYAFALRNVRYGWDLAQRKTYLSFLAKAATHAGGASYKGFIDNMREDFLSNCSPAEKAALADFTGEEVAPATAFVATPPKGPGRTWSIEGAIEAIGGELSGRNYASGRNLFHATACASCHLFDGEGGAIGPDLTSVRNKFSHRDLLEAIIEPSKVISDQYGSKAVRLKNGTTHIGLVVEKADSDSLEIYLPDPTSDPVVVVEADVEEISDSPVSQMPPGLVNGLNENELLDLLAYLLSRGNANDPAFTQP
jgi:putative heme-binding domain-containing protein